MTRPNVPLLETSGLSEHLIVRYSGNDDSRVPGTVFEISDEELARADAYEVDEYMRVATLLASGRQAWVYVDARVVDES